MKVMYTFLKIFTPFLFLLMTVAVLWFFFKWFSEQDYEISEVRQGNVLEAQGVDREAESSSEKLKVLTYNMGFAAGPMQHTLADEHPELFFKANLDKIISMVREQDADILLLQEVDINSKRSWYNNQLDYLMDRLGYRFAAPVLDWDLYFPLRKEKKITKATVVISRYPIVSNEFTLTKAKPNFDSYLLNVFYYPLLWKSCMQRVSVKVGTRVIDVYNIHLCVWSREARIAQAEFLCDWIKRKSPDRPFIIGGDFNFQAYIRGTPVPEQDMAKTPFMNILWDQIPGIKEVLSNKGATIEDLHKYFTFPERNHRYDFIFYSSQLHLDKCKIVRSIDSSDHLPVSAEFRYSAER